MLSKSVTFSKPDKKSLSTDNPSFPRSSLTPSPTSSISSYSTASPSSTASFSSSNSQALFNRNLHSCNANESSPPLANLSTLNPVLQQLKNTLSFPTTHLPLQPEDVLQNYPHLLTDYEKIEIKSFSNIYFVGNWEAKQQRSRAWSPLERNSNTSSVTSNFQDLGIQAFSSTSSTSGRRKPSLSLCEKTPTPDFDDTLGDYIVIPEDHLAYRYSVVKVVGQGAFGLVVKAFDFKCKEYVAIKITRNLSVCRTQAKAELDILHMLQEVDPKHHCHHVAFLDSFMFRNHICIVFELLSINLQQLIQRQQNKPVDLSLIRKYTVQILSCLTCLHTLNVIHCDLKPENILLETFNKPNKVKVIDFGCSCVDTHEGLLFHSNENLTHTDHVEVAMYAQTRFYRSPEVILGGPLSMAVDMWSLGCILAELYIGHPLFYGANELEVLKSIVSVLGMPEPHFCMDYSRKYYLNEEFTGSSQESKTLFDILKQPPDLLFVSFIRSCLEWDPEKRLSPKTALEHPWIKGPNAGPSDISKD